MTHGLKLITEVTESCDSVVVEDKATKEKVYTIEGIFMQGNIKNGNGRVYPTKILEKEMNRYKAEFIDKRRAMGELNHPAGPAINPEKVSHIITEMWKDGDNFYGKAKILDTPCGKIVKTFINEGIRIGVSTRGLGSVRMVNGLNEVQDDFHLATVDIVTNPSGPDCFVNGIYESQEYLWDAASGDYKALEVLESIRSDVRSKSKFDEAKAMAKIDAFIKLLKQ